MMTDVIKVIVSNYLNYANLSDVVFGTVINANPVKIKLDSNSKLQIEEPFLVITNRFKKETLKVSEKVALIKAYGGQKFVILDKL